MTQIQQEKLQKLLAHAGYGSRREIEQWIQADRVRINGRLATLGDRASVDDTCSIDGKPVKLTATGSATSVLIYNKPEGEICSRHDTQGRRTVYDTLPPLKNSRWVSVGRLDCNSSGLLLFTTDGQLANKLMHPAANIDREYACRVLGKVDEAMLQRLKKGVFLEDGLANFVDIVSGGGSGANRWYYVVIKEGRKREIRRLWESQGIQVSRLKRVRYGNVFLPSRLKRGQYDEMPAKEVTQLYAMLNLPMPKWCPLTPQQRQHCLRRQRKTRP